MKISEVWASKRFFLTPIILINIAVFLFCFAGSAQGAQKAAAGGKKTGFAGDPARKRGLELGYDFGLKAGKLDKVSRTITAADYARGAR